MASRVFRVACLLLQCCMSAATSQDNIVELQLRFDSTLTLDERHRQARPRLRAAHPPPHTPGLPLTGAPAVAAISTRKALLCIGLGGAAVGRGMLRSAVRRVLRVACCTLHAGARASRGHGGSADQTSRRIQEPQAQVRCGCAELSFSTEVQLSLKCGPLSLGSASFSPMQPAQHATRGVQHGPLVHAP